MLLVKKSGSDRGLNRPQRQGITRAAATMDRRSFLKRTGVTAGAGILAQHLPLRVIRPAQAQPPPAKVPDAGQPVVKHTICTHCSVGCSVEAIVQNGVWVRQDTAFD